MSQVPTPPQIRTKKPAQWVIRGNTAKRKKRRRDIPTDQDQDEGELITSDLPEDDESESLEFTFLGLDREMLAKECPSIEGVTYVMNAVKEAMEYNEMEVGASMIVMESTGEELEPGPVHMDTLKPSEDKKRTTSPEKTKKCGTSDGKSTDKDTSEGNNQQVLWDERVAKERIAERYEKVRKGWHKYFDEKIARMLKKRKDPAKEKDKKFKMLLLDEQASGNRMLVAVELIKYLKWLRAKLKTHPHEFYYGEKCSKEDEVTVEEEETEEEMQYTSSQHPDSSKQKSDDSRSGITAKFPKKSTNRVSESKKATSTPGSSKTSPKKMKPNVKSQTSEKSEVESDLEDFNSFLDDFIKDSSSPSPEKTFRTRSQSKKAEQEKESEGTTPRVTSSLTNTPEDIPSSSSEAGASTGTSHHTNYITKIKNRIDILDMELEDILKVKEEVSKLTGPSLQSLINELELPALDFSSIID